MTPDFYAFLARIERKPRRMAAAGLAYDVDRHGLIAARPRGPGSGEPLRLMTLLPIGGLAFKAVLFALVGEEAYASCVARLPEGGAVERASAWIMQGDPATVAAAGLLDDLGG